MSENQEEKTEQPTEKRIAEFKKKGRVVYSKDAVGAVTFVAAALALGSSGAMLVQRVSQLLRRHLTDLHSMKLQDSYSELATLLSFFGSSVLAPLTVAAVAGGLVQVGLPVEWTPYREGRPGFDPLSRLSHLFSSAAVKQLMWQLLKFTIIAAIFYVLFSPLMKEVSTLGRSPLATGLNFALTLSKRVLMASCGTFVVLGALDYAYQRHKLSLELRMSKDEIKREAKEEQGSPQLKSKRRALARQLSKRQLKKDVSGASVVVTNPTHYAVALQYKSNKMRAPKVVAKGVDHMAERIKAIASEHNVQIVENRPLARALHAQVKVGREVPTELYRAVAEVLAFVHRTQRAQRR